MLLSGGVSPSTQFLAFSSVWGFWKWSQMIPHTPNQNQNHVSSIIRSWIRISLLEVLLDLLQPLHPVLGLQVDLRLLKMVPNESPCSKTLGMTPKPCLKDVQKQSYKIWWDMKYPYHSKYWGKSASCFSLEIGTLDHVFLKIFSQILIWYYF